MKRVESLDGLRGLAALIVIFHHCVMTLAGGREWVDATILLRPIIAGPSAVLVFFVLSGFVLYLMVERGDPFRYAPYLIKRMMRIYPPLLAAVICSALLYTALRPSPLPALSDWFNAASWQNPPTPQILAGHVLLFDGMAYHSLDNVIWSLVHELRLSLVFPLLALAVRRSTLVALTLSLLVSTMSKGLMAPVAPDTMVDIFASLQYLFLFAAGAAMAKHGAAIQALVAEHRRFPVGPLLLLAGIVIGPMTSGKEGEIGAICLVAASFAYGPMSAMLNRQPFAWLGRVSYSLYLTHLLVLLTLVHGLNAVLPTWLILCAVLPLSLMIAALAYRYVERPSIALGRFLTTPRRTVRAFG